MGRVLCTLQIAVRHRFMWLFTRSPWGRAARQASSARFISGEAGGWYQDNAKMKVRSTPLSISNQPYPTDALLIWLC